MDNIPSCSPSGSIHLTDRELIISFIRGPSDEDGISCLVRTIEFSIIVIESFQPVNTNYINEALIVKSYVEMY